MWKVRDFVVIFLVLDYKYELVDYVFYNSIVYFILNFSILLVILNLCENKI